ncbi:glycosyltransferase family 2 protein [Adlercreutzia murintestinalis]|uniref:glycosyltransferase family 2 protein n=1 Tax=Adlercreutzia murintestinalis TaxID=2941325 RepID=UPI00203B4243|nr:glycosyltransferase [Adlercreutzia murintestinalis]
MTPQPKVSLLIPIYNVETYLHECLDSAAAQTLHDIEIICINDGSTDSSRAIINEYLADPRFRVIDKPNSGYGASMNQGLDAATGEYIGILEPDDFIEPDMMELYYQTAQEHHADMVKGNFYYYWSTPSERNVLSGLVKEDMCGKVVDPIDDDRVFHIEPSIWSALYRTEFIRDHNIRFNETPGASYQDASFAFAVLAHATRVVFIHEAHLHYRQDNEASSVNSPGKVFCVCEEYQAIEDMIDELPNKERAQRLHEVFLRTKYNAYLWNFFRLSEDLRREFLAEFSSQFRAHKDAGEINPEKFEWYNLRDMDWIINDPDFFQAISFYGPERPRLKTVLHALGTGGLTYMHKLRAFQKR